MPICKRVTRSIIKKRVRQPAYISHPEVLAIRVQKLRNTCDFRYFFLGDTILSMAMITINPNCDDVHNIEAILTYNSMVWSAI